MLDNKDEIKKYLYVVKALAIFGTVCAHGASIQDSSSYLNQGASFLLTCLGTTGVPVFYFLAGYFFSGNQRKWWDFWKNKGRTIVIPWITCATFLWLYVVLRKGGISLQAWAKFVIGQDSTMYFVTVLLVLYAVFFYVKSKVVITILSGFSLLSIIESCLGNNILNTWFINVYLNPINWLLYFGLGMLVYKIGIMEKVIAICKKAFPVTTILYLLSMYIHFRNRWSWGYWSRYALFNIFIQISWCFGMAFYILKRNRVGYHVAQIGELSYPIYLCHQFIVGGVVKLTNLADLAVLTLLRPFIVIVIMYGGILAVKTALLRQRPGLKWVLGLIGVRQND